MEAVDFIGRLFFDSMMDESRSFAKANHEMENDEKFQAFLNEHNLNDQRSSLVVFGPENFVYWYGVVVPHGSISDLAGLMKFELPKAEVATETQDGNISSLDLPLNHEIPAFLKKLTDKGIEVYENLGDSDTPYVLTTADTAEKKLTQVLYLKVSD
ncbi:MAG: hypothetical protein Q3960_00455 [Lactobacillus sp.]|nr:hypothetical protein [Lactobacillus sp.]